MSTEFLVFQSFNDPALAEEVAAIMKEEGIDYRLEDTSMPIHPLIIGSGLAPEIKIKLQAADFNKAHEVLEKRHMVDIDAAPPDYYLFSFVNDELLEIIDKRDEWGYFDFQLAKQILKRRGVDISEALVEEKKHKRLIELSQAQHLSTWWIILGYFLSITFSPVAIFYGASIAAVKKTLPDGKRVFKYSASNRMHAMIIMIIGSVVTVILIYLRLRAGSRAAM